MNAPFRLILLVALSVAVIAPVRPGQPAQQGGFWKKNGSAIHNANSGNVGIGTKSPAARLDVAGDVAVNGSPVIDASGQWVGDPAGLVGPAGPPGVVSFGVDNTRGGTNALLNNTGGARNSAFGVNALRSNTNGFENSAFGVDALRSNTTGTHNSAMGRSALRYNTTGARNTASGGFALFLNTTGGYNTAVGDRALRANTTGYGNTATGRSALYRNTTGTYNMAAGALSLYNNTSGHFNTASGTYSLPFNTTGARNTASGVFALRTNTTGGHNTAFGYRAGYHLTTGSYNIDIDNEGVEGESYTTRIGSVQTRAFIAGIRGRTTEVADAVPVLVDGNGQLGTMSSSRRFKEDILDMGDITKGLLDLRPVVFHFKTEVRPAPERGERRLEYGLIAEEVAEAFPDLVVYDHEGRPETVKYHLLSTMLLNEVRRMRDRHAREMDELRRRLAELEGR